MVVSTGPEEKQKRNYNNNLMKINCNYAWAVSSVGGTLLVAAAEEQPFIHKFIQHKWYGVAVATTEPTQLS